MNGCEKYQEMISAMLDGELSDAEQAELQAHTAGCAACRAMYEAFAAVSAAAADSAEEVPADLHERIMGSVRQAEKAKKTQHTLHVLRPVLSAAACLVVLVGTVLALKSTVFNGASAKSAAPAAGNCGVAAEAKVCADAAAPAAAAPAEHADDERLFMTAMTETQELPAESGFDAECAAEDAPEPKDSASLSAVMEITSANGDSFSAVITEIGEAVIVRLAEDTQISDEMRSALTPGCVVSVEYTVCGECESPVVYALAVRFAE